MPALGIMFRCQHAPELLIDFARRSEALGFDELWIVEDCFWGGGIASTALALAHTQKITVGLGILPAVARNAAFTAMELATLARLYPGRFHPGFGHGVGVWMKQVGAFPKSQLGALEEVASAVRALLRGEKVTVAGSHVQLDGVQLNLPPAVVPPISLGVRGPKSLQMAGRVADGTIIPEHSSPAYVTWAKEQLMTGGNVQHRLTVYAWCSVHEDGEVARQRMRSVLAGMLAYAGDFSIQLEPLGILPAINAMLEKGGKDYLEKNMPAEWLDLLSVVGTPAECHAAIDRLGAAGADSVVLVPLLDQPEDQLELIGRSLLTVNG